ncbi:alginate export family protein [Gelidibacter salicanalis]|uniref:Alginate export family protein n=1 Tax=Gelidibacter salicanalis TaxID=291193 RepID=A0A934KNY2_9FLAO|nr:alginate export family protein [Gelidibacter salicanalis]MBJ7881179.1 alginate export family protein [Gelidibacter salicanalis]
MKKLIILACLGMLGHTTFAQEFGIDLQLRPRVEYRHGYKTLMPDHVDAATFVSQRSRLNFNYGSEKLNAYISLQNIRVWGEVATLSSSDANGTAIHEAWASFKLDSLFSFKMGRQEIIYDDSRMFGNVDWSQTGRSHDAFIATYQPNAKNRLDLGIALNEEDETLFKTDYNVNNYKAFQYLRYHTNFDNFNLSLLALNTGFTFDKDGDQEVDYNQTIGAFLDFGKDRIKADASVYFQTGQIADRDLSAFNLSGNLHYQATSNFNIGIGAEYLSGTDMNSTDSDIKAFNPLFGTNHKFNGWMDYFYVGNHINSVGLVDVNLPIKYQKDKLTLQLIPHVFSSAATVVDLLGEEQDNYLGTEIDFSLGYKIAGNIDFQLGYSHMFASDTMQLLKGGNNDTTNNWAWAMFVFKPKLFTHTK